MPITVDQTSLIRSSAGSKIRVTGKFSFTTYTTGGDAVTAETLGMSRLEHVNIEEKSGYDFAPVINTAQSQMNVQAFASGGGTFTGAPLAVHTHDLTTITEETVGVVADVGTLAFVPSGVIQNVYADVAGATGPKVIVPDFVVPVAGQVSVENITGTLTFAAADAVTQARVTYAKATTQPITAGTPSGTISGGAGGEVANGTNLAGVGPISFEIIGL